MLTLFEEGVGAPAVAEVEELPGLAAAEGNRVVVDEDFDGAHVPGEVAGLVVGPGQRFGAIFAWCEVASGVR